MTKWQLRTWLTWSSWPLARGRFGLEQDVAVSAVRDCTVTIREFSHIVRWITYLTYWTHVSQEVTESGGGHDLDFGIRA
jgi:hypothetical protein